MKLKPFSRKVCYYETDKMGIVHHSNYIRWLEEARVHLIEQAGLPFEKVEAQGIMTPVLSAECEYRLPFKFGDEFFIKAVIDDFGKGVKFSVVYEITDREGTVHATGKTTHCFVDMNMRPVRIQKTHPDIYSVYNEMYESREDMYE